MSAGHVTAMAGEFFVMERLFRLGYEPALTLGNAKSVDILVYKPETSEQKRINVKSVRAGGKWSVGHADLSGDKDLIFVFLLYRDFDDLNTNPDVWVMSAEDVNSRKRDWLNGASAIYYSGSNASPDLGDFKNENAWKRI